MRGSRRFWLIAGAALGALGAWTPVQAQEAAGARPAGELEEVVVTARRREESLQDVPTTVTAVSGEQLRSRSITSTADLQMFVPALKLTAQVSNETPNFIIRGQGRPLFVGALPAVVTYVNDVPLPQDGSIIPLYDVASVQVLKGPQGTLFGRNTTGGAILIGTERPTFDGVGGYAAAQIGNYDLRQLNFGVNLPLVEDKLALRLAGEMARRDGYIRNLSGGPDLDDKHSDAGRASLLWRPTEFIENLTVLDAVRVREAGTGIAVFGNFNTGTLTGATIRPFYLSGTPGTDLDFEIARHRQEGARTARPGLIPLSEADIWGVTNDTRVDLGSATLRNIFGYRRNKITDVVDVDGTPLQINARQNSMGAYSQINLEQFSEELQLSGSLFGDRLNYIVGAFYLDDRPVGMTGQQSAIAITPTTPTPLITSTYIRTQSKAVFAQATFDARDVLEGLKLTAGVRYTKDERSFCVIQQASVRPQSECGARTLETSYSEPTYNLSLEYSPNSDILLYAATRRGYRGGGVNTNLPSTSPVATYDPELATDYEVGVKTEWRFGGVTGRFNASLYRMKVDSLLSNLVVALPQANGALQNASIILNAAQAKIDGYELELVVIPTDGLTLSATYEGFDGRFTRYVGPPEFVGGVGNLIDTKFNAPPHSLNLAVNYRLPVDESLGRFEASANYHWEQAHLVTAAPMPPHPDLIQASYGIVDLRLDWKEVVNKPIDLGFFVRNAGDKLYRVGSGSGVVALTVNSTIYGPPRTYGVDLRYRF